MWVCEASGLEAGAVRVTTSSDKQTGWDAIFFFLSLSLSLSSCKLIAEIPLELLVYTKEFVPLFFFPQTGRVFSLLLAAKVWMEGEGRGEGGG